MGTRRSTAALVEDASGTDAEGTGVSVAAGADAGAEAVSAVAVIFGNRTVRHPFSSCAVVRDLSIVAVSHGNRTDRSCVDVDEHMAPL